MPRYVALLRGINVGGNKKVPMARLRELLERVGYSDVVTLLQSGNAVFTTSDRDASKIARKLEKAIASEFGFHVDVLVRSRDELASAIEANPLHGADEAPAKFLVFFLSGSPDQKKLTALDPAAFHPDEFRVVGRELYARFPNGVGRSKLAAALNAQRLGVTLTGRNWSTVRKLLELADR